MSNETTLFLSQRQTKGAEYICKKTDQLEYISNKYYLTPQGQSNVEVEELTVLEAALYFPDTWLNCTGIYHHQDHVLDELIAALQSDDIEHNLADIDKKQGELQYQWDYLLFHTLLNITNKVNVNNDTWTELLRTVDNIIATHPYAKWNGVQQDTVTVATMHSSNNEHIRELLDLFAQHNVGNGRINWGSNREKYNVAADPNLKQQNSFIKPAMLVLLGTTFIGGAIFLLMRTDMNLVYESKDKIIDCIKGIIASIFNKEIGL